LKYYTKLKKKLKKDSRNFSRLKVPVVIMKFYTVRRRVEESKKISSFWHKIDIRIILLCRSSGLFAERFSSPKQTVQFADRQPNEWLCNEFRQVYESIWHLGGKEIGIYERGNLSITFCQQLSAICRSQGFDTIRQQ